MGYVRHKEIKIPQKVETQVTFEAVPNAYVRYAYSRSSDSMANQIEGQDYLCFRYNDEKLVFVVCDGVGSSFCGNLAARILGDEVLDWLWMDDIPALGSAAALQEVAIARLNRIQKIAGHEVESYQIPGHISPLIRQALEQQRAYGSEAIFVAGRIDHPSFRVIDGMLSLFWMGDTQARVLDEDSQPLELGGDWSNANRWSTAQGVRGTLGAWMEPLTAISRVAAFTDGLLPHADGLLDYADDRLDKEMYLGARLPSSDDVAFIDIVLRTPHYEGYSDPSEPDPAAPRPELLPIENPDGEPIYELRWAWPNASPKDRFIIQEATNPALTNMRVIENVAPGTLRYRLTQPQKPGHYYYRVRAFPHNGAMTPWSELRKTRVAHPPPPAPVIAPLEPGAARPVLNWAAEGDTLEYRVEESTDPAFEEVAVVYEGRNLSWAVPTHTRPGTYYYRVCAIADGRQGPYSDPQAVEIRVPPPPRPHMAAAAIGYEHGSYELRWQPVSGATRYELEEVDRSTGETQVLTLQDSVARLDGQPVGEYVYRVRACHDFGCSEWSNEQTITVAPERPVMAPDLAVTQPDDDGNIHLDWTAVEGASEYIVQVSEDGSFADAQTHQAGDTLASSLRRSEPGLVHIRVCAANAGGRGPWSQTARVAIAPRVPGWFEVNPAEDKQHIELAWGSVGSRIDYRLEMVPNGIEDEATDLYHGPDTRFELTMPGGAGSLYFRVRSEMPGVHSAWQISESLQLDHPPATPILEEPEITDRDEIRLLWTAVDGATTYIVEVARDEAFADILTSIPVSDTTRVTFSPPRSGHYWFRVKATAKTRQGEPSNRVKALAERPAPPHLWRMDAVRADTPYEIAWKGMPGVIFYEVQESPLDTFPADQTESERVQHPLQRLERRGRAAGRWYYRVRAIDDRSQSSKWSDPLVVDIA